MLPTTNKKIPMMRQVTRCVLTRSFHKNAQGIESETDSLWTIGWDETPRPSERQTVKDHQEFASSVESESEYSYGKVWLTAFRACVPNEIKLDVLVSK
jgi:hypothetical protein